MARGSIRGRAQQDYSEIPRCARCPSEAVGADLAALSSDRQRGQVRAHDAGMTGRGLSPGGFLLSLRSVAGLRNADWLPTIKNPNKQRAVFPALREARATE
jgi:hypothetical protein